MNTYLIISSTLIILMMIAHSYLGEKLILRPLQTSKDLPIVRGSQDNTRSTLRFAWHVTSVLGFGIALILFYYAGFDGLSAEQSAVIRIFSVTFFISFLVALVGSKGRHLSWAVFLALSILTWVSAS